jgi:hypothetical protein
LFFDMLPQIQDGRQKPRWPPHAGEQKSLIEQKRSDLRT